MTQRGMCEGLKASEGGPMHALHSMHSTLGHATIMSSKVQYVIWSSNDICGL